MRAIALWGLLLMSCGGPSFKNQSCKLDYDSCLDRCADACEPPRSLTQEGPQHESLGHEDWNAACGGCVSACRDQGERCEGRSQPGGW